MTTVRPAAEDRDPGQPLRVRRLAAGWGLQSGFASAGRPCSGGGVPPPSAVPSARGRPAWPSVLLALVALIAGGCGANPADEARRGREAELLASEANFAANLRDWPRVERALVPATALAPGRPELWLDLGAARVRLGRMTEAREAYTRALEGFERQADSTAFKGNPEPTLNQVRVLALLGRLPEARAVAAELPRRFPGNPRAREFIESRELERLTAERSFREVALPAAGR